MRWNAGLAALAAAWGLVAVLAAAVELDAGRSRSCGSRSQRCTLARRRPPDGRLALLGPDRTCGCCRARRRPGGALVPLLRGGEARLGGARRPHLLHGADLPRGPGAALPPGALSNVALGALVPGGIGIALVALAGEDGTRSAGWRSPAGSARRSPSRCCSCLSKRLLHARPAAHRRVLGLPRRRDRDLTGACSPERLPADAGEWAAVLLLGDRADGALDARLRRRSCATRRPRRRAS